MKRKITSNSWNHKRKAFAFAIGVFTMLICFGTHFVKAGTEVDNFATSTITGTVTDADGAALPGANVLVKGTSLGTITDIEGKFSIDVEDNAILVVSFIGFVEQEISTAGQSVINVSLKVDAEQLDEVVVTGYTSQSKERVTGAMSQVNTKEAFSVPIQSVGQGLQGRASGVHIVGGGQPGSTPLIRVRGFGTTNENGPLIVIDGMQTTDAGILSQINPNDIEAVNVLKDASAAIYGARASNGVIIITTKTGTRGQKPTVSFSSYVGFQKVGKTPEVLNSEQLGDVLWESFANAGVSPTHPQYGSGSSPVIPEYINGGSGAYDFNTNRATRSANPGTNWVDEIFRSAPIQNYDLSIQGAGERSRYLLSAGYQKTDGIQLHTGFERFVSRLNAEFDLTDNIRVGEHLSVASTDLLDQNQMFNSTRMHPLVPLYDEGGNFAGAGPSTAAGLSNVSNPVANLIRGKDNFDRGLRVIGDIYVEASFLNDFTVRSTYGVTSDDHLINEISRADPEAPEPKGNSLTETNSRASSWIWSNTLKWDKSFGDHELQLLGGVEAVSEEYRINALRVQGYQIEDVDFFVLGAGTGTPSITQSSWTNSTLFSYLFNANYSFKNKFLASVAIRQDKSSRFGDGFNSGIFPSMSLGWVLSEEGFMDGMSNVSFLKLRTSYGQVGNQDIPVPNPDVNILELQQELAFYAINGSSASSGALLTALGTPELQWETAKQFNIGIDLGLFNDNVNLSVDYFNNTNENMIIPAPVPSTAIDADAAYINAGEVNNSGFDIALNIKSSNATSDFQWDFGLNLSAYTNKLNEVNASNPDGFLPGQTYRSGILTRSSRGLPISYFYGREVIGIFQDANEVSSAPDQGFASSEDGVGRFRYRDIDGSGTIDDNDRTIIGSPHPDFVYGINGNITYKKFFLTLFLQGVSGNEVYNHTKIESDFPTFFNSNRSTRVLDSWSSSNTGASLPALGTSVLNNEVQPNTYFVEDGSYLRLKNLQFGYNFNLPKLGVQNARIYFQGSNLFTITDYDGADPEIGNNAGDENSTIAGDLTIGVDDGVYPIAKTYVLGLNFTF